jgi:hypothetical protein
MCVAYVRRLLAFRLVFLSRPAGGHSLEQRFNCSLCRLIRVSGSQEPVRRAMAQINAAQLPKELRHIKIAPVVTDGFPLQFLPYWLALLDVRLP